MHHFKPFPDLYTHYPIFYNSVQVFDPPPCHEISPHKLVYSCLLICASLLYIFPSSLNTSQTWTCAQCHIIMIIINVFYFFFANIYVGMCLLCVFTYPDSGRSSIPLRMWAEPSSVVLLSCCTLFNRDLLWVPL